MKQGRGKLHERVSGFYIEPADLHTTNTCEYTELVWSKGTASFDGSTLDGSTLDGSSHDGRSLDGSSPDSRPLDPGS